MTELKWYQEMEALKALVSAKNLLVKKGVFYTNGYDAPTKFFSRRNEVWLVKN